MTGCVAYDSRGLYPPHYTQVVAVASREKSFTVNDIADGVVNSLGLALTLAFWTAHDAREIELGRSRIQGY